MPNVSRAQTGVLKMQGAWGAKDIFNEMAQEYVNRVNEMAGGRLQIDYLLAGAVVKPFSMQDAVHDGVLDAGHSVPAYWYGKTKAASLFGTGPVCGWNAHQVLAWIYHGGGQELYDELSRTMLGLNVVGFFAMPMPTQPLGWFKNAAEERRRTCKGLKYRTVGLAADVIQAMGMRGHAAARRRDHPGDGARRDRRLRVQQPDLGPPLRRPGRGQELHAAAPTTRPPSSSRSSSTRPSSTALPEDLQAILEVRRRGGVHRQLRARRWTTTRSDLQGLRSEDGVNVHRTPPDDHGGAARGLGRGGARPGARIRSSPRWSRARRPGPSGSATTSLINEADYRLAYEHYFGKLAI